MKNKDTFFPEIRNFSAGEKFFDFSTPKIMGILNLTPDSFYDGGKNNSEKEWLRHTEKMLEEGADIIDLGAVSTRPGASPVSADEEMKRLLPPLKQLTKHFPDAVFSVDTYRARVAEACVEAGTAIINDISGGTFDNEMFRTIARLKVPYVLMHIYGKPQTMQKNPLTDDIILSHVRRFFEEKVAALHQLGVKNIILDPGFGFGKTPEANYKLLHNMESLRIAGLPLLAGVSRKSMINKVLGTTPAEALNGTTVIHTLALMQGANLLRVHDVKEARQTIEIIEFYRNFGMSHN